MGLEPLYLCSVPLSLEVLAGPGQLPDKICSAGICRNSLALLREQTQEVQQLKKDLTRLTAEMSSLKTVMPCFVKEGVDGQGPHRVPCGGAVGFSFSAHPAQPAFTKCCCSALKSRPLTKFNWQWRTADGLLLRF